MSYRQRLLLPLLLTSALCLSGCFGGGAQQSQDGLRRPTSTAEQTSPLGEVPGRGQGDAGPASGASTRSSAGGEARGSAPLRANLQNVVASHTTGFAGHSVTFTGASLGDEPGSVTWGDEPCVVTSWTPTKVSAYLPSKAQPASKDLVVRAQNQQSKPMRFTVTPPELQPSRVAVDAFAFMRDKMRNPEGGVYTNFIDRDDPDPVYLYGHHQTAEHMGLMLWVSAAIQDHKAFEESYQYVARKLISPRYAVVNWGVDKFTNKVALQGGGDEEDLEPGDPTPPSLHA